MLIVDVLVIIAVFTATFISGDVLNTAGMNYSGDVSGTLIEKIHPYSWICAAIILTLLFSGKNPWSAPGMRIRKVVIGQCIALVIMIGVGLLKGAQGVGYILDTIVVPSAFMILVGRRRLNIGVILARLILIFFFINGSIAILEFSTKTALVNVVYESSKYFRATALHGHPLNNALITVGIGLIYLASSAKIMGRLFVYIFGIASLIAFGARAASLIFLTVGLYLTLPRSNVYWKEMFAFKVSIIVLFAGAVSFALFSGILGGVDARIPTADLLDDSAMVRLDVWQVLAGFTPSDYLLGLPAEKLEALLWNARVDIIENYLLFYLFNYGVIASILLLFSICAPFFAIIGGLKGGLRNRICLAICAFMVLSATNNSLATKSAVLLIIFSYLIAIVSPSYSNIRERKLFAPLRFVRGGAA